MSYFDEDVLETIVQSRGICSRKRFDVGYNLLNEKIPLQDSSIDWTKIPSKKVLGISTAVQASSFLIDMLAEYDVQGSVYYFGDNLDYTYELTISELNLFLTGLLEIPQRQYVTSTTLAWIFEYTFDGNASFAFIRSSPSS